MTLILRCYKHPFFQRKIYNNYRKKLFNILNRKKKNKLRLDIKAFFFITTHYTPESKRSRYISFAIHYNIILYCNTIKFFLTRSNSLFLINPYPSITYVYLYNHLSNERSASSNNNSSSCCQQKSEILFHFNSSRQSSKWSLKKP